MVAKVKSIKRGAASVMLRKGATLAQTSCLTVLKSVQLRVTEKGAFTDSEVSLIDRKNALVKWAKGELADMPNAWDTNRVYISHAAAIALVPDAVGKIADGVGENAPTHDVTVAQIKTRRDMSAVGATANAKLGIVKKARSGRAAAADKIAAEKLLADATQKQKEIAEAIAAGAGDNTAVFNTIVRGLQDGETSGTMRITIIEALAHCGFQLAPLVNKPQIVKPIKKPEIVKPKGKPMTARQIAKAANPATIRTGRGR